MKWKRRRKKIRKRKKKKKATCMATCVVEFIKKKIWDNEKFEKKNNKHSCQHHQKRMLIEFCIAQFSINQFICYADNFVLSSSHGCVNFIVKHNQFNRFYSIWWWFVYVKHNFVNCLFFFQSFISFIFDLLWYMLLWYRIFLEWNRNRNPAIASATMLKWFRCAICVHLLNAYRLYER